ncbi:MAG TPA: trypsin-like peptidase domain-containing protein [Trebonia sp.]|nr:trypsin-like peptidase domain-containing protein [Trebonia sp.]
MDQEPDGPDGVDDAGSSAPRARRFVVAGVAGGVVLLLVIAVLATRLASLPGTPAASASGAAASPSPSPTGTMSVPDIFQRVSPSVVTVKDGKDLGAGVIVSDSGTILTAAHVVAGKGGITVTFADGTVVAAAVTSADTQTDIAVLTPAQLPQIVVPATLGGSTNIGETVVAVGNPLGLTDSVSSGVVSGLNRSAITDTGKRTGLIQFDAAINPGSSGGPLLDDRGMVVGIVVALADPTGQDSFAGIGFAVPIGSALGGGGKGNPGKGPQI